jgi:hypothetical protein
VFASLSLRAKLLIGIALTCAAYVLLVPDTSGTVEPARGADGAAASVGRAPRVIKPATAVRKVGMMNASLRLAERIVKDTAAGALFAAQSWYVAPPPPPPSAPASNQPPPAPTAPPLPFVFMGSYKSEDGGSTYFLTAGDRVYDVKVGDNLDNTYSVDSVKSGQMLLTYMPLKIQQSLSVGEE